MGHRGLPPGKSSSIAAQQAVPMLEDLIRQGEELKKINRDAPQQGEWVQAAESLLEAAFGTNNSNLHAFGSAQTGIYHPSQSEAFRQKQFLGQASGMVAVLQLNIYAICSKDNLISGMTGVAHLVYMSISCATPRTAAARSPAPQENRRPMRT